MADNVTGTQTRITPKDVDAAIDWYLRTARDAKGVLLFPGGTKMKQERNRLNTLRNNDYLRFIKDYGVDLGLMPYTEPDISQPTNYSEWLNQQKWNASQNGADKVWSPEEKQAQAMQNWKILKDAEQQDWQRWGGAQAANAAKGNQQAAAIYAGIVGDKQKWDPGLEKTYDEWKNRLMSELSGPEDWIQKWEVHQKPNPYTQKPESWNETRERQTEELDRLGKLRASIIKDLRDPESRLTSAGLANPDTQEELTASRLLNSYDSLKKELFDSEQQSILNELSTDSSMTGQMQNAALRSYTEAQRQLDYTMANEPVNPETGLSWGVPRQVGLNSYEVGAPAPEATVRPTGPAAPQWLSQFAPGQTAGRAITKSQIGAPSAQEWGYTPDSVKRGLQGYVNWSGGRSFNDVLLNMDQMLPNRANVANRWSPSRQG